MPHSPAVPHPGTDPPAPVRAQALPIPGEAATRSGATAPRPPERQGYAVAPPHPPAPAAPLLAAAAAPPSGGAPPRETGSAVARDGAAGAAAPRPRGQQRDAVASPPASAPAAPPPAAATAPPSGGAPPRDSGGVAARDAAARETRRVRFEAAGPAAPPPKPWWGGTYGSARLAVYAAAVTMLRLSRRACTSLIAASLHGVAGAAALPPGAAASRCSGYVVRLCGGLFCAELIPPAEARARGGAVAEAATAASRANTFAISCVGSFVLATSATEAEMNGLLAIAVGLPSTLKRAVVARDVGVDTVRSLAGWTGGALPALVAAVAHSTAIVDAAARADGNVRDARSLTVRAHGHLLYTDMVGSVAWDAPASLVPASAWLRGWSAAALQAAGVVAPSARPSPRDPREIVAASGWRVRTKATSGYPFPRQPYEAGHVPTWDVAAVVDAWEAAHGPLADDDPLWTLFSQMWLFEPAFDDTLHARLAEAPAAVVFPGVDKPHVHTPLTVEAETVKIPEMLRSGIVSAMEPAAALARGNAVSAMIFVPKTKIKPPAELAPLMAGDEGRATPKALAAVARAAQAEAAAMTGELRAEIAQGVAPAAAADIVLARRGTAGPVRACHDGRALSEYVHCTANEPQTVADFLRVASPSDRLFASDFASYYYTFVIHPSFRRFFVQRYAASDGRILYFQQNRLSMGVRDSGTLAQGASAVCAILAMSFEPALYCAAYVDDMMGLCAAGTEDRCVAALGRAMALCVPGGGEAMDKRVAPSPTNTLVGQRICLTTGKIFLELKRFYAYMLHLFAVQSYLTSDEAPVRAAVTSRSTERLVGKLAYLAEFAPGMRVHLHGLYAQNYAKSPPSGTLRPAILSDVGAFAAAALEGTLAVAHLVQQGPSARLHTRGGGADDGTGRGPAVVQGDAGEPCGAVLFEGHATALFFSPAERGLGSDHREMATTLHGFRHFLPKLEGRSVLLVTDHSGNACCINKGNAASPAVRDMIRELYRLASAHRVTLVAVWCPRECNIQADAISKCTTTAQAVAVCAQLGVALDR